MPVVLLCALALAAADADRITPIDVRVARPTTLRATFEPTSIDGGALRGACPPQSVARTDSDFGPGQYILQGGFAEGETLAVSFDVDPSEFPIRIDLMEVLFATSGALVQTTTQWSVMVWDGTPASGSLVASYSSDDIILPHLVMPPGTTGTIISVTIDPDDPDQIYVYNDSGTGQFTVGFRVDAHNQPGTPCVSSPPATHNAFPATDTSGLDYPTENWINMVDGVACVCGSGWTSFANLPGFCTPSGDWVLRATYPPVNCTSDPGACCVGMNCQELDIVDCNNTGGAFQGQGTTCAEIECGTGVGACCIPDTGACIEFDMDTCLLVDGLYMGEGTACDDVTCFPEGACCLPSGACIGPVSPEDCLAVAGTFEGDGTSCASIECPQPEGACCGGSWCLDLGEEDCAAVGGDWHGDGSECADPTACSDCHGDINADGIVDVTDLLAVIGDWGAAGGDSDVNADGIVDVADLLAVIGAWGACP